LDFVVLAGGLFHSNGTWILRIVGMFADFFCFDDKGRENIVVGGYILLLAISKFSLTIFVFGFASPNCITWTRYAFSNNQAAAE